MTAPPVRQTTSHGSTRASAVTDRTAADEMMATIRMIANSLIFDLDLVLFGVVMIREALELEKR